MRPPAGRTSEGPRTGTVLLAPALLFIGALTVYPLFYSLWASFTNLRLTSPGLELWASRPIGP